MANRNNCLFLTDFYKNRSTPLETNQGPSIFTSPKVSSVSLKVLSGIIKDKGIR